VRAAILAVEGVLGLHELHIWQVRRVEPVEVALALTVFCLPLFAF
jgi:Co/Zn/Cd efflux system component